MAKVKEEIEPKKQVVKYGPTDLAVKEPRRVRHKNKWIGLGGEIRVEGNNPRVYKEATATAYRDLAPRFPSLIQTV